MPIYEYACRQCGHQDTDIDSFSAARVKKCPACGKKSFARLISASSFHLKGGGWYETDFKNKNKKPDKVVDKSDSAKGSDKTDSGADKTDSGKDSAKGSDKADSGKSDSAKGDSKSVKKESAKSGVATDKKSS